MGVSRNAIDIVLKRQRILENESKILEYLNGDLNDQENHSMQDWIANSDRNKQCFDEIKKLHELSEESKSFDPNVDLAWEKVANRTIDRSTSGLSWVFKVAAAIILVSGIALLTNHYQQPDLISYSTRENETKKIELEDGSIVWLNEHSVFEFPSTFGADEREVKLSGQAFFDIEKDPNRPFQIMGDKTNVMVLGTSFDLISKPNYSNVNVISGKVLMSLSDDSSKGVTLTKGKQASFKNNVLKVDLAFNENASSWMTNTFVFKSTPLNEVVDALMAHYDMDIKLESSIVNCLITSSFENKELKEILDVLSVIAKVTYVDKNDVIILSGEGC